MQLEPRVQLLQRLEPGAVAAALPVATYVDQPGGAQHLQVPGHAGLVHADEVDQLADRPLLFAHGVEDAPLPGLRHLLEFDVQRLGWRLSGRGAGVAPIRTSGLGRRVRRAPGAGPVRREGRVLTVVSSAGSERIIEEARALHPVSVDVVPVTLKEVFLESVVSEA